MTAIKKKIVKKSVVKKLATKKASAKKVSAKKAPAKKAPAKKAPAKKAPVEKTEPKTIPTKKWDEGGVDFVKKAHNRLRPYSVNIASTSGGGMANFPFGDNKTLVEPKKEISKSKLQKFIEKAEKIIRKRYSNEPMKLSTFNKLVKEEVDRIIEIHNTRKTINEVLKERFDKEKECKSFSSPFKLKSNGKYNVGTIKGVNIVNKDKYTRLKVLILTLEKDEIKLLENGLPIKFILEK
jgi:hypothetical protein